MFLVGFIILFSIGVAIIVKLETDFYFRYRAEVEKTVFSLMVDYFRKHILYFLLALASLAGSFASLAFG